MKRTLCVMAVCSLFLAHGSVVQFQLSSGNQILGSFQVELFDQDKPVTVSNFFHYVESGAYSNSFFHRSILGFVVQGGGYVCSSPLSTNVITSNNVAHVSTFGTIIGEANYGTFYSNTNGTIAMALSTGPNSATSEFFFNLTNNDGSTTDYPNLDDSSDGGPFTVFGRVISGWTNLESVANFPDVYALIYPAFVNLPVYAGMDGDVVQPPCDDLIYYNITIISGQQPVIPLKLQMSFPPGGKTATISWPAIFANYILQSTTNLALSNWGSVTDAAMVTVNSNYTVTVTNTLTAQFFRLYNTNTLVLPPSAMSLIPAGSFTMGDTFDEGYSDELPLHTVYVSAFEMDQYDVTLALWQQVYNWAIRHGYTFDNPGVGKALNHPVQTLSWYDAVKWCNARSEIEGRTPAYYLDATQTNVYRSGDYDLTNSNVNWNAGYRLPTEAEWEKAARGGISGQRFPFGNTISWTNANYAGDPLSLDPDGYAYDLATAIGDDPAFDDGVQPYTSPVGSFAPNGYGLYDMVGDVWQWLWDWYGGDDYSIGSQTDPRGPMSGSYFRMIRGGVNAFTCRTAYRDYNSSDFDYMVYDLNTMGFRCVRAPGS